MCYNLVTTSCTVTQTLDSSFDEYSQKCQNFFDDAGFDVLSDAMDEFWVGGTEFCAVVNQSLADSATGTSKGAEGLPITLEPSSVRGCSATSPPPPTSSSIASSIHFPGHHIFVSSFVSYVSLYGTNLV